MELTIQELSERVDMTPRNIREWQTIGVLLPPRRRGRLAFYDESHVWRIERVKSLRGDGFPLDVIRQFLERPQASAADVLTLSATVLDSASHGGSKIVDRVGLAERIGADAEESLIGAGWSRSSTIRRSSSRTSQPLITSSNSPPSDCPSMRSWRPSRS